MFEPDPELDFCSRCHEHAEFVHDTDTGELLSTCCSAKPEVVDVDPWNDFDQEIEAIGLDDPDGPFLAGDANLAEGEEW
jgi:hypothetical protein